jgi:hypothetical protein
MYRDSFAYGNHANLILAPFPGFGPSPDTRAERANISIAREHDERMARLTRVSANLFGTGGGVGGSTDDIIDSS